jgi:hypothetical protein
MSPQRRATDYAKREARGAGVVTLIALVIVLAGVLGIFG